jgi:hypothetical protein
MSAMCFKNQLKGMVVILRLVNSIKYVIIYFKIQGYKEADYCLLAILFKKTVTMKIIFFIFPFGSVSFWLDHLLH